MSEENAANMSEEDAPVEDNITIEDNIAIEDIAAKTPMHLWIIGVVTLLWNAMGAFDYLMTKTHNESYMEQFTPEQLEFFYGFPFWVNSTWAIAVWGSVLGSALLLARKSLAVPVFLVSLVAMALTFFHNFFLKNGMEIMGGVGPLVFTGAIVVVAIGLYMYSDRMKKAGVLK